MNDFKVRYHIYYINDDTGELYQPVDIWGEYIYTPYGYDTENEALDAVRNVKPYADIVILKTYSYLQEWERD